MSSDLNQIVYINNIGDYLYRTVGLFIITISSIGNICNCFVFCFIPALNKHPNALFIIGSSFGSFIFINMSLCPSLLQIYAGISLSNRYLIWCKMNTYLSYSAGCFSFLCHSYAAFGQYLITLPRVKWQRLITRFRAKLMLSLTAFFWLCIYLPLPIYNTHIPTSSTTVTCTSSLSIVSAYSTYWLIIGYYFSPILLTLILFGLTWYNLKQLLRRRRQSVEGAVTRMMLIQMSFILLSGIPTGVWVTYMLATQNTGKPRLRLVYEYLTLLVFTLCTYLTNGSSFWVYFFASKPFRKHLKEYFLQWKLFQNRIRPINMSSTRTNLN